MEMTGWGPRLGGGYRQPHITSVQQDKTSTGEVQRESGASDSDPYMMSIEDQPVCRHGVHGGPASELHCSGTKVSSSTCRALLPVWFTDPVGRGNQTKYFK